MSNNILKTLLNFREKKNIHLCLNPFISPEQERQSAQFRAGALRPDKILFRWVAGYSSQATRKNADILKWMTFKRLGV